MAPAPSQPAPQMTFDTIGHGVLDPVARPVANGTLVAFFRHGGCRISRYHLKDLDDMIGDFAIRGTMLIAASADSAQNLRAMAREMQIARLPIAHSLDLARARAEWGLHLSRAAEGEQAPAVFAEPAHFWLRGDGTIGLSAVCSTPHLLPEVKQLLRAVEKATPKGGGTPYGSYPGDLPPG